MTLEKISEEFDQCIKCGLCLATCPVCKELLLEKYTPRGKVQLARFYSQGDLALSDHSRDIFAKCMLCGACATTCPSGVNLREVFLEMRDLIAKEKGAHPAMTRVVESLEENRNIAEEDNEDRGEWRDFMKDIPAHLYERDRAEAVYFVGCVASFFPMVQSIPQNFVHIMDSANVDFTILAGDEWCCGFPLMGAGVPDKLEELKDHNLKRIRELGVKKVIFSCPSCYQTWKEQYNTDLELYHSSQFIENIIKEGKVTLDGYSATVTYHDPCDLGRNSGVYDAPREILKSIPGLKLVELGSNRAQSICCGGGGNVEMSAPELSGTVARKKIEEIQQTGADTVVTSCQQCVRIINTQARRQKIDLNVMDITEVVLKAMSKS